LSARASASSSVDTAAASAMDRDAARALVRECLVWDNHACMPLRPDDARFLPELAAVRASGVDVISLNIGFGPIATETHLQMLDAFHRWLAAHADDYAPVRTVAEIDAARAAGKLAVFFDVEGMAPLDAGRLDLVEAFRDRGVGWMLIAYNRNNDAGGGCLDEDGGLTRYGRAVLAEMKRVGMIVCCSHTGHRTAMQVLEAAENPVIFSHSNAAAVFPHYRNIPDTLIKACAATGGVVGVNGLDAFLGAPATAAAVARHIDHIAQLVGPAHVGLGLDYVYDRQELVEYFEQMRDTFPDDLSYQQLPEFVPSTQIGEIAAELAGRGYDRAALAAILGGNWRRVASQVWG
jgi:membrane dipeptidase